MRKCVGIAFAIFLLAIMSVEAFTVDELIEKNIQAKGGIEKIRAIQSIKESGKMRIGDEGSFIEMDYVQLSKRPAMLRVERSFQGLTAVTAYDGADAWRVQPFRGRKDPEKISADDLKALQLAADIDGPLVDYKIKGHKVEYLGTEDVDGTDAHKLKITLKNGDVRYVYLDPDYFLEIRVIDHTRIRGVEEEDETDLGDYEQVNGVYVPFSIESGDKGQPKTVKVTIEKVEVNTDINDSIFHFPGGKGQ